MTEGRSESKQQAESRAWWAERERRRLAAAEQLAEQWRAENPERTYPDLDFRCPDCPMCFEETRHEDGQFICDVHEPFRFYAGDRVQVVPRVSIDSTGLAGPTVSAFAGQRGTVAQIVGVEVHVWMDASGRPKRPFRFRTDDPNIEVQVVVEDIIGPFSADHSEGGPDD